MVTALAGRPIPREAEEAAYRVYRLLTHGILAMLIVFFLAGDGITWINLSDGLRVAGVAAPL